MLVWSPATMLKRLVEVRDEEVRGLGWSFAYFLMLMVAYALLKPVRDEMAIVGGLKKLDWVFTATFLGMLVAVPVYSALAARWPRRRFVPWIYRFCALTLVALFALWHLGAPREAVARVFFVWVSVFNLFITSVFWSFMADVFRSGQGKRLFGFIAAGGTIGAMVGPLVSALIATRFGAFAVLPVSIVLFEVTAQLSIRVGAWAHADPRHAAARTRDEAPVGGGPFSGFWLLLRSPYLLSVAGQTLLYAITSTILYTHYLGLVSQAIADSGDRTALFGYVESGTQALTLGVQLLFTGRVLERLGLVVGLGVMPALTGLGFLAIAAAPLLWLVVALYALRRSTHYAFERPSREVLFTEVDREARYKSKSFIDTVVYRGGDALSATLNTQLGQLGVGVVGLSLVGVPMAAAWLAIAVYLARRHHARERAEAELTTADVREGAPS